MPEAATGSVDTAPRPGSLQEAQSAFETFLSQEEVTPPTAKQTAKAPLEDSEATGDDNADAEESPGDETADDEVELDENGDPVEPKSEDEGDEPTESLYTVTIDGKEEQVRASELIAGYQRNQSYTRKSMALAEERKAFAETQKSVAAEREEYAALIPQLRKALTVSEPDWAKVKAETPELYPTMMADWQLHKTKLDNIAVEERRVNAIRQKEFDDAREQLITSERNAFLKAEPSWKDVKVASRDAKDVQATLAAVGFSGDELNIYDHRALRLALMAAKYRRGVAAKAKLVTQRADGAPVIKSGAGPAKKVAKGAAEQNRFNKSGKVTDLAKVFEQFL